MDALLGEHAVLNSQIEHVDAILPAVDSLAVVHAVASILTHALLAHAQLEDELLFGALERFPAQADGVVRGMRRMHADIEEGIATLFRVREVAEARELLSRIGSLAWEHFRAEEEVCFPLAEDVVPESVLQDLAVVWTTRRGVAAPPALGGGELSRSVESSSR